MEPSSDFFLRYLQYTSGTEVPATFNRWSSIGMVGAWLGRQVYCKFGSAKLYPNQYIKLMGSPGTKKSTAIKGAKRLLREAGYETFAGEKISKEKYLLDLGTSQSSTSVGADLLDQNLWGVDDTSEYRESWIVADEFNDFFANNILEFCSTLGVFWDYEGVYENRIKNGQSVVIPNPTISILGGNTQTAFSKAFPPDTVGQGFFSRVIAIYSKPNGVKIPWPKESCEKDKHWLLEHLHKMRSFHVGEMQYGEGVKDAVAKMYTEWEKIDDVRFESYGQRRQTHLLKLSLLHAASRLSPVIEIEDCVRANTLLHHAERFMPSAFGEFGASRVSSQIHKVLQILDSSIGMTTPEIWAQVQTDFDSIDQFVKTISGMQHAGKIQTHGDKILPVRKVVQHIRNGIINYDYLTKEELQ